MFCPSCGNEITVELKYCNRCGANLTLTYNNLPATVVAPVKLTVPTLMLGLMIVMGLAIIIGGATGLADRGVHPFAIVWMVLFSMLTLFGSAAMLLRFWSKILNSQRQSPAPPPLNRNATPPAFVPQQLPPRYDPASSVTEHTTRTFSPIYREPSEPS
ncbi:MAG TPA: zinc ribbon domain-containing protein [Pyrinomonadaceae bacterium]|nr:zinc ribbon domain-containing protein [Pyrinomonadaceae bacterium]